MANLTETPSWEAGIYRIETTDPVVGGESGISNQQGKQLANRTSYLKAEVESLADDIADGSALGSASVARAKLKNGTVSSHIRNCLTSGPVDSNGAANHCSGTSGSGTLNINGSPFPIRMTFAYGYDDLGQVDFAGKLTTDETYNIGSIPGNANVLMYFRRDVATGNITIAGTTDPVVVSNVEPGDLDSLWFSPRHGQWFEWVTDFGGVWSPIQIVFFARVIRNVGGNINEVRCYDYLKSIEGTVSDVPVGTIVKMPVAPSAAPLGWLPCNGALVSRTIYAGLYNLIGTTFGSGSGTFEVPTIATDSDGFDSFIKY